MEVGTKCLDRVGERVESDLVFERFGGARGC